MALLIVGGGTAPVMLIMGAAIGASIGIEAYTAPELVSLGPVSGVISAFANTRELAPSRPVSRSPRRRAAG